VPRTPTRGFTLVEILGVVVLVAVLAAIALSRLGGAREKAEEVTAIADLRHLAVEQETHRARTGSYARGLGELPDFRPSAGVTITVTRVDGGRGWAAVARHARRSRRLCGVFFGTAESADAFPAVVAGIPACADFAEPPPPSPDMPLGGPPQRQAPTTVMPPDSQAAGPPR